RASSPGTQRRRLVAATLGIVLVVLAAISIHRQVSSPSTAHTSITQRLESERATRQLWLHHPFTGVGLRFFATPRYVGYQPPNDDVNEALAEGGIPALIGFVVFIIGSIWGLARGREALAAA